MRIPLNASTFGDEEIQAAIAVLKSGMVTMNEGCFAFEEQFAKYIGSKNAIFVNSGSSANLLAFFALANPLLDFRALGKRKFVPGSEVIVPAVTWSTTIWPIVQAGGVPVLVDSDPKTLQIDIEGVKNAISDKTVAICPVHVLGNAVPMKELKDLADRHGLWLIEDTCESLGTKHDKKFVGTIGDLGTYSFFFSHHITTIEGGMIVTDNDEIAELLRCLRAHGWTRHLKNRKVVEEKYPDIDPRFMFVTTGFNVRPTEINAAFGKIQLTRLDAFNTRRQEIAASWLSALAPHIEKQNIVPMRPTAGTDCTWFGFPVLCKSKELRSSFQKHLEQNGIETRPIICGNLARQPAFNQIPHRISGSLSGADQIMDNGVFWGSHPMMSQEEVDYVSKIVNGYFK